MSAANVCGSKFDRRAVANLTDLFVAVIVLARSGIIVTPEIIGPDENADSAETHTKQATNTS